MSEVEYEFVKGQGWVPKRKPSTIKKVLEEYITLKFDEEIISNDFWAADYTYRPYIRRPRQITFDEFRTRVEVIERPYELELRFRFDNGRVIASRVEQNMGNPFDNELLYQNALMALYRDAEHMGL